MTLAVPIDVHPQARFAIEQSMLDIRRPSVRRRLVQSVLDAVQALNDDDADVVVLAARRMLCLYLLLRDRGVAPPERGEVVSDRFIDVLPQGTWEGLRVLVVDDTIISGASADRRQRAVERLTGATGSVRTLVALDPGAEQDPAARRHWLREEAGNDFHNQFGAVLGKNLVPYFTDFAVSERIPVAAEELLNLLESPLWRVAEVSSAAVVGSGARAFSCFPTQQLAHDWLSALGPCSEAVELLKVRLFVRELEFGYELRMVPVVLMRPQRLLTVPEGLEQALLTAPASVNGLLGFALSRALFAVIAQSFPAQVAAELVEDAEHRRAVLGDVDAATDPDQLSRWRTEPVVPRSGLQSTLLSDAPDRLLVGDDTVLPLFRLIDASKRADGPGTEYRRRWTLRELVEVLQVSIVDLSLALDVLNDVGYAVPAQIVQDGVMERAYRAGELDTLNGVRPSPLGGVIAALPASEYLLGPAAADTARAGA